MTFEIAKHSNDQTLDLRQINFAAAADIHYGPDTSENYFLKINSEVDFILLAGDLTQDGKIEEIEKITSHLSQLSKPVFVVLGNHDHHSKLDQVMADKLNKLENVKVLQGGLTKIEVNGKKIAILGFEGFAGGFNKDKSGQFPPEFFEAWNEEAEYQLRKVKPAIDELASCDFDIKIALLHYMPFKENIGDETKELSFLLGSRRLGEILTEHGFDLVLHGHAHNGSPDLIKINEKTLVSNVALPANKGSISLFSIATANH